MVKTSKKLKPRFIIIIALILGLVLCFGNYLQYLPEQLALIFLKVSKPDSYEFRSFDELLRSHVKYGLIDYQKLKSDPNFKLAIDELARTSPAKLTGRMEQLCFWINAYNLGEIKSIVDHYPSKEQSGRNLAHLTVGGRIFTLAEIKEEMLAEKIILVNWKAIFLLCNGDISSPCISTHAYRPGTLNEDAERAYKMFVLSRLNYHIDEKTKTFFVSPFYLWNNRFFLHDFSSVFEMVNNSLPPQKQLDLNAVSKSYMLAYDRRINDLRYYYLAKNEFEAKLKAEQKLEEELSKQTQASIREQIKKLDMRDVPARD